jgi:hypothetical protein
MKAEIFHFGGAPMFVSSCNAHRDSFAAAADSSATDNGIALLEEILIQTIAIRDLYRLARHRSAKSRFHHLVWQFEAHHRDQLRLVDVLVERMRALGGGSQVVASAFVRGDASCAQLGRLTPSRLLSDLLDAHELVLSAIRPSGSARISIDQSAAHDFAVGGCTDQRVAGGSGAGALVRIRTEASVCNYELW